MNEMDDEESSFPVASESSPTSSSRPSVRPSSPVSPTRPSLSRVQSAKLVKPKFRDAWYHFYDTLPKRIKDKSNGQVRNRLALPGEIGTEENPVRLWNPFLTTSKDLDAFG